MLTNAHLRVFKNTAKGWLPLLLAVFLFIGIVGVAGAQAPLTEQQVGIRGAGSAEEIGLPTVPLRTILVRGVQIFLGFLGIVFVIMLVYGGYMYMTAGGAAERVDQAKRVIRNAVVGMVVSLASFAIVSFFAEALLGISGGPGAGAGPRYGTGSGALGNGIIESHYPGRNAFNIPRNTSVIITFKEEMDPSSMIEDSTNDGIYGNCIGTGVLDDVNGNGVLDSGENSECDVISSSIKIRKADESATAGPFVNFVRASMTADGRTIVLKPATYLGNAEQPERYAVDLTGSIAKATGQPAFGSFGSYSWSFEVSTEIDVTPPRIESVIPYPTNDSGNRVARNAVVQINFNEAINPLTTQGVVEVTGGGTVGDLTGDSFDILQILTGSGQHIAGSFMYSNQYKTVEFVSNDVCGINSCNEEIYCLPGNETIEGIIRAAKLFETPVASFPYTGIVDMADNSLDGNSNGTAEGTALGSATDTALQPFDLNNPDSAVQGDDARWRFFTNNTVDLVPPEVVRMYPSPKQFGVNPRNPFEVEFDKLIMASSLKPDSGYGDGYCGCSNDTECGSGETCSATLGYCVSSVTNERSACVADSDCSNTKGPNGTPLCTQQEHLTLVMPEEIGGDAYAYWVQSQNSASSGRTTALLAHETLGSQLRFQANVGSGIKDLYQNCYQPCSGPGCDRQAVPGVPGKYVVTPGAWLPDNASYPTCDLTQSALSAEGSFRISYDDGTGFKDRVIQAFSFDQDAEEFYGYVQPPVSNASIDRWGAPFNGMLAPGRAVSFLYHNSLINEYYLFVIYNSTTGGAGSASLAVARAALYGSTQFLDDSSDAASINGAHIALQHAWNSGTTDGAILDLGNNSGAITFDLSMTNASNITDWKFYFPGGSVDLDLGETATITPQ